MPRPNPTGEVSLRGVGIVVAAIAVVSGVVDGIVNVVQFLTTYPGADKMTLFWTAAGPVVSAITLLALLASALYARSLIFVTRDTARTTLSDSVLNSTWINNANDSLTELMNYHGNDLNAIRAYCNALYANPNRNPVEQTHYAGCQRLIGAYQYLARLYLREVLDEQLLIESCTGTVVPGVFVLQDRVQELIHAGFYDDEILDFARVCIKRFQKRPQILLFFPVLRGWTI